MKVSMTISKQKKLMICDALIIAFTLGSLISASYVAYAPNKMVIHDTIWKSNGQYFRLAYTQLGTYAQTIPKRSLTKSQLYKIDNPTLASTQKNKHSLSFLSIFTLPLLLFITSLIKFYIEYL